MNLFLKHTTTLNFHLSWLTPVLRRASAACWMKRLNHSLKLLTGQFLQDQRVKSSRSCARAQQHTLGLAWEISGASWHGYSAIRFPSQSCWIQPGSQIFESQRAFMHSCLETIKLLTSQDNIRCPIYVRETTFKSHHVEVGTLFLSADHCGFLLCLQT